MKRLLMLLLCAPYASSFAQEKGIFTQWTGIGKPALQGSFQYAGQQQTYTLSGSGYNIWFNRDEFQFLHTRLGGDFILTANFTFTSPGGDPHKKTGWMIRESLDDNAVHASATRHADGLTALQWRLLRGAYMRDPEDEIISPKKHTQVLQLERKGKTIIMRVANPGEPLQAVGMQEMKGLPDSVYAGLFVCAHDPEKLETVRVWNVRIDKTVPDTWHPNPVVLKTMQTQDPSLPSRMEIVDISSLERKVIYESKDHFEAPNWMPDGKSLLFNQGGKLYTLPVAGGSPVYFPTGDLVRNNNDHGISFDGKMLAISSHRDGMPGWGSTVYVMPLAGGTPKLVTPETPSYWHGWSPDGKSIVHVGQRKGNSAYNLYRVDIATGKETPLTQNSSGHVDGCEYSPDGKFIYYNANPTGTMQLWRMKSDGSGQEQVTFDEYHNWFPHFSPDGKWIAFISFPTDIDPNSHPPNKPVMLRVMPASGGAPKVIAHLYGGQGTINVNSWSPDSKRLAFVSYTK
jgi:Tol biopolymer transport system component